MAGREVSLLPDDMFIVSYPKSGNTWVRFLIGNMVSHGEKVSFKNVENKVPDIYQATDSVLLKASIPRYLKSHEYFDPRYQKVIYIVRDPRDVLVSYYHHHIKFKKIAENESVEDFSKKFIKGDLDTFGTWDENVNSWLSTRRKNENFLLLKYEEILNDQIVNLKKIASFIKIDCSDTRFQEIAYNSSADNMKKLEKEQFKSWKPTKDSRDDKYFVRKAKCGEWKNELPVVVADEIVKKWGDTMKVLGYL